MLYFFAFLVTIAFGFHNPQSVTVGYPNEWTDFIFCDHDEWVFENPDANVHSIHRNGGDDLVTTCHYGEWGGSGDVGNNYGFTYFNLVDSSDVHYTGEVTIIISFRLWGFCNWQNADRIMVTVYDQYNQDVTVDNTDEKTDFVNNYDRSQLVYSLGKKDSTCDDGTSTFTWDNDAVSGAPDWLGEVPCTTQTSQVSCYTDKSVQATVEGGILGLEFSTTMDDPITTGAWAYSNIHLSFPPQYPCCTGTRTDKPNKSCGAFHEKRNCESKGCTWSSASECSLDCCRFFDKTMVNKDKPQCKSYDATQCSNHNECTLTMCDMIGVQNDGDGL